MVKIPLTVNEINKLLQWRDENKELVRAGVIPFPECEIVCNSGMKIRVKKQCFSPAFFEVYSFTVTNTVQHEVVGRFNFVPGLNTVKQDSPALNQEQTQDCLTVWASAMAYIVNHVPEEIERTDKKTGNAPKKQSRKAEQTVKTIYLRNYIYTDNSIKHEHRNYTKPDHAFAVRGHYRHLKSGKVVFVQPYEKNTDKQSDQKKTILKMNLEG